MQSSDKKRKFPTKSKFISILGAFLIIFSLIGIYNVGKIIFDYSISLIDQTSFKDKISHFVSPFVIVDIPEFTSIEYLDNNIFISTAVWKFIIEADLSLYETDEFGNLSVPQKDIESYVYKLFGSNVKFTNGFNLDPMFNIVYDEENLMYQVPSQPQFLTYTPEVISVEKAENNYIVTLNYLLTDPISVLKLDPKKTVVKSMQYVLIEDADENLRISQVKILSVNPEITPAPVK